MVVCFDVIIKKEILMEVVRIMIVIRCLFYINENFYNIVGDLGFDIYVWEVMSRLVLFELFKVIGFLNNKIDFFLNDISNFYLIEDVDNYF